MENIEIKLDCEVTDGLYQQIIDDINAAMVRNGFTVVSSDIEDKTVTINMRQFGKAL